MVIDDFNEILEKYWIESEKPLKGNEFANKMRKDFKQNLVNLVNEIKDDDVEYIVKISPGAGNWKSQPFAGILDKEISNTFQHGLYVVYSFRDESGFNLSIGQGIDKSSKQSREEITNSLVDFISSEQIDIPMGFEVDENKYDEDLIISKFYKKEEIEFDTFRQDLKDVLSIYKCLKSHYLNYLFNEEPYEEDLRNDDDVKIWRVAPGSSDISDEVWDDFKKYSYVGIDIVYHDGSFNKEEYPNFPYFKNKYSLNNFLEGNACDIKQSTEMIWKYINWIHEGDIIVVNNGRNKLAGIGVISGEFISEHENNFNLNNIYSVDWILTPDNLEIGKNFFSKNLMDYLNENPQKWNELVFTLSKNDENLRKELYEFIFSSFCDNYLSTDEGKDHLRRYNDEKEYIITTWKTISNKHDGGEDISEDIWNDIIDRDIKIHSDRSDIKSVIQGKSKFSNKEMQDIAILYFETMNKFLKTNDDDEKISILKEYSENILSTGIKTGRFTPVLHYLDNSYYVINKKLIDTVELLSMSLGEKIVLNTSIEDYMSNNVRYKNFLKKLKEVLNFDRFDLENFENFDSFCHWICDKRWGYYVGEKCRLIPTRFVLGYEKNVYPKDLDFNSNEILKDLVLNLEEWEEELPDDGISVQEYFEHQVGDLPINDLEICFDYLFDKSQIKLVSESPEKRYDLNVTEDLPVNLNNHLIESKLKGFAISDKIINQTCASLNAGKHIIFEGTPGTGKTELAIKFSSVAKENKYMNGHLLTTATSDWSTFDTIGGLMPDSKGILKFRPGKFLEAIEKNQWIIIDEINRADIDKAFGQLFTVLSGQDVELPYEENDKAIKIKTWDELYCKHDDQNATYYIGQNWRIIGTMNVDDKDSLFDLSYAFMRRFMFIEVDLPSKEKYLDIIDQWSSNLPEYYQKMLIKIYGIVEFRKLGPAIFKDMISYIKERDKLDSPDKNQVLGEAIDSYILPQLEGLNNKTIKNIEEFFKEIELYEFISNKFEDLKMDI